MRADICVVEEYEKNGEKKVKWNKIGEIFQSKKGKHYAKLFHMPGVLLSVFDAKPKEKAPETTGEFGPDEEIPF